jgi:hypothetical protein
MNEKEAKKRLRELADLAWEEELRRALTPLADAFERWKTRAVTSLEISDLIHEFHQGPSRKIWSTYQSLKPDMLVARAIALGVLPREALPAELADSLAQQIEFSRGSGSDHS